MTMNSKTLVKVAFLNATGTFTYTTLVMYILFNGEHWSKPVESFLAPVLMLTLFMISATVTGGLVLGRPIYLIATKKIREGITLLIATLIFLCLLIALVLLLVNMGYFAGLNKLT